MKSNQKTLYLFYRGNSWLNRYSLELVLVCDDLEIGIRKCQFSPKIKCDRMTRDQAEQVREIMQSQCTNNVDYEWYVETITLNEII